MLNVIYKKNQLFVSAEQGSGKHSNNILVIPNPKFKYNARKWISTTYSKLKRKDTIEKLKTSFQPILLKKSNEYQDQLKSFIQTKISNLEVMKYKNFEKITQATLILLNKELKNPQKK